MTVIVNWSQIRTDGNGFCLREGALCHTSYHLTLFLFFRPLFFKYAKLSWFDSNSSVLNFSLPFFFPQSLFHNVLAPSSWTTLILVPSLPSSKHSSYSFVPLCLSLMHQLHIACVCHVALSPTRLPDHWSDTHHCYVSNLPCFFVYSSRPSSSMVFKAPTTVAGCSTWQRLDTHTERLRDRWRRWSYGTYEKERKGCASRNICKSNIGEKRKSRRLKLAFSSLLSSIEMLIERHPL